MVKEIKLKSKPPIKVGQKFDNLYIKSINVVTEPEFSVAIIYGMNEKEEIPYIEIPPTQ